MGRGYIKHRLEPLASTLPQGEMDAMWEKLRARTSSRAGGSVVSATASEITATAAGENAQGLLSVQPAASVSRERHPLEWERVNAYALRTLCRTWTCSKVCVGGEVTYELWRRIAGLERSVCVRRGLESFDDAEVVAQTEEDAA